MYSYDILSTKFLSGIPLNPIEKFVHKWIPDPDKNDSKWLIDFDNALKFYEKTKKFDIDIVEKILELIDAEKSSENYEIIINALTSGDWFIRGLFNELQEDLNYGENDEKPRDTRTSNSI